MMDQRHLSSPSPTSPFLYLHSERCKSTSLTPLLSSTADVTSVDDCFTATATSTSDNVTYSHHHHDHNDHHNDHCVIDQDSLNGVDDVDRMHNMLSAPASSGTPSHLLAENHTHHFSRISLEEYSPLSLVGDCDNSLPISPTTLTCSSHLTNPYKMNGMKIENLVNCHADETVDDCQSEEPTGSISPTLMSTPMSSMMSSLSDHQHWSHQSSHGLLLSQQSTQSKLPKSEPLSLDEAPRVSDQHSIDLIATDRPSSEPPTITTTSKQACGTHSPSNQSQTIKSDSSVTTPRLKRSKHRGTAQQKRARTSPAEVSPQKSTHTQLHLQLNHHKKLQELQQRLFGNNEKSSESACVKQENAHTISIKVETSRPEADSSDIKDSSQHIMNKDAQSEAQATIDSQEIQNNKVTSEKPFGRRRRVRSKNISNRARSKVLDANKVERQDSTEPDTTTRSSEGNKYDLGDKSEDNNHDVTHNSSSLASTTSSIVISSPNQATKNSFREVSHPNGPSDELKLDISKIKVEESNTDKALNANQLMMNSILVQSNSTNQIDTSSISHQVNNNQPTRSQNNVMSTEQLGNNNAVSTSNNNNSSHSNLHTLPQQVNKHNNQIKAIMTSNDLLNNDTLLLANLSNSIPTQNVASITTSLLASALPPQALGARQIAIQVICQDGTSLVLPVSSAAGLNAAAASIASQQQQIQAALNSHQNNQQQQHQFLQNPFTIQTGSMSTIVAHNNNNNNSNSNNNNNNSVINNNNNSSTNANNQMAASAGLAASSPTLAALLDSGSFRPSEAQLLSNALTSQQIVSPALIKNLGISNVSTGVRRNNPFFPNPFIATSQATNNNASLSLVGVTTNAVLPTNSTISNHTSMANMKSQHPMIATTGSLTTTTSTTFFNGPRVVATETIRTSAGDVILQTQYLNPNSNNNNNNNNNNNINNKGNSLIGEIKQANESVAVNSSNNSGNVTAGKSKSGVSTGNRPIDSLQPFRCEHCSSTFTRLGNFTRHKKIHTVPSKDGQRFKCDACSKSFLQRCDLARHLHIHRGTEPHRCNICGKGYIRHSDLVTHKRFHNKEKPFGCPHCSKGFCQRGDLNRHLRSIHLQMKPILCPFCNRKFAKQETLLRHLNTSHRCKSATNSPTAITNVSSYTIPTIDCRQSIMTSALPATMTSIQAIAAVGRAQPSISTTTTNEAGSSGDQMIVATTSGGGVPLTNLAPVS